jgi:hypothetical protein
MRQWAGGLNQGALSCLAEAGLTPRAIHLGIKQNEGVFISSYLFFEDFNQNSIRNLEISLFYKNTSL